MKTQTLKDLQTKTLDELKKMLKEGQDGLVELKLSHQQNKLKNTRSIFITRKEIAAIKTIMRGKKEVKNG
jgi:ribosomal protein L29